MEKKSINLIEVISTKRSGHHAIINWMIKNFTHIQIQHWFKIVELSEKNICFWNDGNKDIDLGYKLFREIGLTNKVKNLLINYEDSDVDYCLFSNNKKFNGIFSKYSFDDALIQPRNRVLFIRNFFDTIISRYVGNINNIVGADYDKNFVNIWKKHAYFYINNSDKCIKYEDWILNENKRKSFLLYNFNITECYDNKNIIGTNTSFVNKEKKDLSVLPEETKDLIRKDNELHYLIGALGYEYKEI